MDLLQSYESSDEEASPTEGLTEAMVVDGARSTNKRKQEEGEAEAQAQAQAQGRTHPLAVVAKVAKRSPRNVLVPPQVATKRANAVTEDLSAVKGTATVITKRK